MSSVQTQTNAGPDAPVRKDGRGQRNLRPLTIIYEGLARADGSARFGFGLSQVLTSVSGPIEARPAQEHPSQAVLDVHVRPLAGIPGTDARALASTLKLVLTPSILLNRCPRTLIQLVVQALCATSSNAKGWSKAMVASAVNSASLALLNTGSVPMRGVVCAVAVGRERSGADALVLDPADEDTPRLAAEGCFAFLFSSAITSTGEPDPLAEEPTCHRIWTDYRCLDTFGNQELAQAQEIARQGARSVWRAMKESVAHMDRSARVKRPIALKIEQDAVDENAESEVDDEKMEIA